MRIALGWDHRGADVARVLQDYLPAEGHEVLALGRCDSDACDYPDVTWPVARAVAQGEADRGILACGTGIGASIAANKVHGVRAALVHDETAAELSRRHNDANVLCLAGDSVSEQDLLPIIDVWLASPFDGGRHERRVAKIAAMERGENPARLGVKTKT